MYHLPKHRIHNVAKLECRSFFRQCLAVEYMRIPDEMWDFAVCRECNKDLLARWILGLCYIYSVLPSWSYWWPRYWVVGVSEVQALVAANIQLLAGRMIFQLHTISRKGLCAGHKRTWLGYLSMGHPGKRNNREVKGVLNYSKGQVH